MTTTVPTLVLKTNSETVCGAIDISIICSHLIDIEDVPVGKTRVTQADDISLGHIPGLDRELLGIAQHLTLPIVDWRGSKVVDELPCELRVAS